MSTIENLDEDCLIEIFSYLNICDRQCAEQVCKKWRSINRIMWRSMKNLVFILEKRNKTLVEDIGHSGLRIRSDNILYLGDVLKMFDGNLTKLVFQYSDTPFATEDPPKIPNWILQLLSTNKKIIWARIEYSISDLIQILKFLPTYNLQYLSLELNEPYRISTNEDTEEVFRNVPRLTSLKIKNMPASISHWFNEIKTLKSLEFISGALLHLNTSNFINLEKIVLMDCSNIDDNFMMELVKNCQKLHTIAISNADVSANGMNVVTSLPNLRHLDTPFLNYELFNNLSNLEEIYCENFQLNVTEYQLSKFLQHLPNLKQFNFNDDEANELFCKLITKLGMKAKIIDYNPIWDD